ncbi:ABC transporter permease [Pseudoalteromonas obscura]|uniref:ABC transporter permease n=1 Tax=Pseudoalteromonas obscura TaxID=3048491 RepID=A0ABT7EKM4_9GAMM|nr:ABC transporter permease [Pseudoalteromonas sp. P94(2023)]MDK2595600.1 ABC transporter permease [Pseudoalteromonas sp. P94(2023)]
MILKAYVREAWRSLIATKQRTLLALIGISIGIGAVISMVAIGQMVSNEALRQFRSLGSNLITLSLYDISTQQLTFRSTRNTAELHQRLSCVELNAPLSTQGVTLDRGMNGTLASVSSEFFTLTKAKLAAGRQLSHFDGAKPYVVIGAHVPELLGLSATTNALIGQRIKVGQHHFTVIGALTESPDISTLNLSINTSIFTTLDYIKKRDKQVSFHHALIKVGENFDIEVCERQIHQHFYILNDRVHVNTVTAKQLLEQMREQTELLDIMLAMIAGISLLLGGVGIMNIMLMSVTERKQEIGIRRAMGAKQQDIRSQFLIESICLCVIGGVMGVLIGVGASYAVASFYHWVYLMPIYPIVLGSCVSILTGICFGFIPANHAAKLDPIDALQCD